MNNYQKIMRMRPFDLIDVLARSCPTSEDMRACRLDDYPNPFEQRRECRRCWNEWLSREADN